MLTTMNKLKFYVIITYPKSIKIRSLPYCYEIFDDFKNEEAAIQFSFDKRIFIIHRKCSKCTKGSTNTGKVAKHINIQRKIVEKKYLFAKEHFLRKVKFKLISYLK